MPHTPADPSAPWQALQDREEIRDVIHRYCRGVDRSDPELLTSCYHEDAIEDHGGLFLGPRDAWVSAVMEDVGRTTSCAHFVTNISIELDGDEAFTETYVLATAENRTDGADPQLLLLGGRYVDRFVRRDGMWRILRRTLVVDWSHTGPMTPAFGEGAPDPQAAILEIRRGQRSHDDPGYADSARALLGHA